MDLFNDFYLGCYGVVGAGYFAYLAGGREARRYARHLRARGPARRGELAAIDAAERDPAFEPEAIQAAVWLIVEAAEARWLQGLPPEHGTIKQRQERQRRERAERGDRGLHSAPGPERPDLPVILRWIREAFHRAGIYLVASRIEIVSAPHVDILRVVHRSELSECRVVVRVELRLRDPDVTRLFGRIPIDARWTLARDPHEPARWLLAEFGGDALARTVVGAQQIPDPVDDDDRLSQATLRERGVEGSLTTVDPGTLIDAERPAPDQLRELGLLDDRFSPALIEADLRRIVEAWRDERGGHGDPLHTVAAPGGIAGLRREERTPRDGELVDWTAVAVRTTAEAATLELRVTIRATMRHPSGSLERSDRRPRQHRFVWTLERDPDPAHATTWRLTGSRNAGEAPA